MAAKDLYEKDFYKILGVSKSATPDEIKKKYRTLARELHPDKTRGDAKREEEFKAVSEAYDILSDTKKKAETTKRVRYLNAVVFVRQLVVRIFKVEISVTCSAAVTHKIFSLIYLVADVAVHAKDKIYRPNQRLHFANLYLAQR